MNRETCGYLAIGHFCVPGTVYFISRAFDQNDYCVGGKRVSVFDDGKTSANATTLDLHAVYGYELRKYNEYLEWREQNRELLQGREASPFNAGITHARRP